MGINIQLINSPVKHKKYRMLFYKGDALIHRTDFGSRHHQDYTQHHDDIRKERFKNRFQKLIEKDKDDPTKPITLSNWILWRDQDMRKSLKEFKQHFFHK